MINISQSKLINYLDLAKNKTIAVIGDVMLDEYLWGDVSRVSPEAPVPVVDITERSYHLGGAANVAQNLASLGCEPIMCGLLGVDNNAIQFANICSQLNITTKGLFQDKNRVTTTKTRVIGNQQQIVRVDNESTQPIDLQAQSFILDLLKKQNNLAGIIFEDYDKGTITPNLIQKVTAFANESSIPIFVDPKVKNFSNYSNVTLFKPNRKETETNLGVKLSSQADVMAAGKSLLEKYQLKNVLITLGADGMVLFESDGNILTIPTVAKTVADVSGAGDTAISILAAMFVSGATLAEAAMIANIGAGIICEKLGVVAIDKNELINNKFLK